jgi:hypothetical protein
MEGDEWAHAAGIVLDAMEWFLGKCRANGMEWSDIELMLREHPDCTEEKVEAVRAAWEMQL